MNPTFTPRQAVAAIQAMGNIEKQVDTFMRGQSTPVDVLMKISQIVGAYQMEKP